MDWDNQFMTKIRGQQKTCFMLLYKKAQIISARGLKHIGSLCCIKAVGAEIKQSHFHSILEREISCWCLLTRYILSYTSGQSFKGLVITGR